jgi:hypothetical protein
VDKLTGTTTMYRNDFANGQFAFTNIGVVTGSATCTTQYGFDFHDNGVRWHDIDGDGIAHQNSYFCNILLMIIGRADFLCFKKNGVVYGYLNKGVGNMINQGMIKHTESRERQSKFIVICLVLKVDILFRSSNGVSQVYAIMKSNIFSLRQLAECLTFNY